jgi:hypothetical protein
VKNSPALRAAALLLAAVLVPACMRSSRTSTTNLGAGTGSTTNPPSPIQGATSISAARLSGAQEVPPVTSSGSGNSRIEVNDAHTQLTTTVNVNGLSNITEAHIHAGPPGVDGPIIFPLASGPFTSPLTVVLTSADLVPAPAQGINTFADAVDALTTGRLYVNVHTAAHPEGEIRSQLGPVQLSSSMTGAQAVPAVSTSATGTTTVLLSPDQTQMAFSMNASGVPNATSAAIQAGGVGVNGPTLFTLNNGSNASAVNGTLTSANFQTQPSAGITSFAQAVDAMLSGNTFVNVGSAANPGGEIRGQITSP